MNQHVLCASGAWMHQPNNTKMWAKKPHALTQNTMQHLILSMPCPTKLYFFFYHSHFWASYVRYFLHILQYHQNLCSTFFVWILNVLPILKNKQWWTRTPLKNANVRICAWNNNFGYSIEMEHKMPLNSPLKHTKNNNQDSSISIAKCWSFSIKWNTFDRRKQNHPYLKKMRLKLIFL